MNIRPLMEYLKQTEEEKQEIEAIYKENPKLFEFNRIGTRYISLTQYSNFRRKHIEKYKKTPSKTQVKLFNLKFYLINIFPFDFVKFSILLFAYILGILLIYIIFQRFVI